MATQWEELQIEGKLVEILSQIVDDGHHFRRPYLTAYQLAIELNGRYPEVGKALKMQVGGAGTGEHTSLAQYLARSLSGRIKSNSKKIYPIEGAFLSCRFGRPVKFGDGDNEVTSTVTGRRCGISMFRLRETDG